MNITGNATIYVKDFDGRKVYSMSLSKKNAEGKWETGYMPVNFPKEIVDTVQDKAKIEVIDGWLSFYKNKEGNTVISAFINKFKYRELPEVKADDFVPDTNMTTVSNDDDLPF